MLRMESVCLPHTEIPGASKLFADFLYRFDRVAEFFGGSQGELDPFAAAATALDFPGERRARLVSALGEQNGNSQQLSALAKPGTVAVVTGQQVGLFSGPCYAIYKALTAAKLAHELTARGIPAVPVFWLATEDHDSQEINHCQVFDHRITPQTLRADTTGFDQQPVGSIPVRNPPIEELRTALSGLPHGDEVTALVADSYSDGRSLGEAFHDLMGRLLSSLGLLFLDPMRREIRELAAPLLRQAASAVPEMVRLLFERNRALEQAGYHTQVHVEANSSLLFRLDGDRRLPLRHGGTDRAPIDDPMTLSPNALLRPVMQDYILPTVAYVAGPAEVAYLAQSHVLHQQLLGRMPIVVPRSGFSLLDGRSTRLMARHGISISSCFHGLDALRQDVADKLLDTELGAAFHANRDSVTSSLDHLRARLAEFDLTLADSLDMSRRKILYQLRKTEGKAAREALRREQRIGDEISHLYNLIFPAKHLQERYYTILPFLARHGLDLIGQLYENVNLACRDHIVMTV